MTNLTPIINERVPKDKQILLYLAGYCAQREGYGIYAVGEFIRDLLLFRNNKRVSLLVDGSAVDYAKSLQKLFSGRLQVQERYGTATFFLQCGTVFDLATARREFSFLDENPSTEHTFLKNDLFSRDFTINALACSLNPDKFGLLYDLFNGKEDLEQGIIRILYKLSFVDDPLRIVRAIRFEQRFHFTIEEETLNLLTKAAANRLLNRISKERLYHDVLKIFREPSPLVVIYRLEELELLNEVFPRIPFGSQLFNRLELLEELFQVNRSEQDVGSGEDSALFRLDKVNPTVLYLTLFFNEMTEHDVKYLIYLMRLRKKERDKIFFLRKLIPGVLEKLRSNSLTKELLKDLPEEAFPLLLIYGQDNVATREKLYRQLTKCRVS